MDDCWGNTELSTVAVCQPACSLYCTCSHTRARHQHISKHVYKHISPQTTITREITTSLIIYTSSSSSAGWGRLSPPLGESPWTGQSGSFPVQHPGTSWSEQALIIPCLLDLETETFNMAAAETKAPQPCLQITLLSQTIPLTQGPPGGIQDRLDDPVSAAVIIVCVHVRVCLIITTKKH